MNWTIVIIVAVVALALLIFINIRNQKDKKDLTNKLKNDYRKTKDEENDASAEE